MNPLLWVGAGLVAYTLVAFALHSRGLLPPSVRLSGPLTTIHTRRGRALLDRLARSRRFWRAWSNVGLGITLVIMAGSFVLLVVQGLAILRNPPAATAVNQPRNFLVIPGVNDFLPLSVAPEIVFGLLLGLVVHEGGHGLLCRVEGIDIESMGLVTLAVVPIGAFVEPDEESQRRASRGARTRMFAAGVTNNFAVAAVAFALLFGPVIAGVGVAPGVPVADAYGDSPADRAGIDRGDRITAVAGQPVTTRAELDAALAGADDRSVAVELNGERTVTVERDLVVAGTIQGNPLNLTVDPRGDPIRIAAVNGTPVATRSEFRDAVRNRTVAEVTTSVGTRTAPVGAFVRVAPDGPLANASAPADANLVVTAVDGERVTSASSLTDVLATTSPGETVTVETYRNGTRESYRVTLGEGDDGSGFLGVGVYPGTSGVVVTDFGVQEYPAGAYLEYLGGDGGPGASQPVDLGDSALASTYEALLLPLASFVLGIPNFPGFTGYWTDFYVVRGPLAALGRGGAFLLVNGLFWTAWINLQLGLFNCIPGYPLDGGRILRTSAEAVVSRLPVEDPRRVVRAITTSVGVTMLVSLFLLVFGPTLLR
ncbi:MAG: site-2 protease family protein [Haloferacaceae archaeon]